MSANRVRTGTDGRRQGITALPTRLEPPWNDPVHLANAMLRYLELPEL